MVRTTEDLGRRGGVCAEEPVADIVDVRPVIDRARKLFASTARLTALAEACELVEGGTVAARGFSHEIADPV